MHGFTLSPSAKGKKELTPWYVDNIITPALVIVEKYLLENPNFFVDILKGYKEKELYQGEGKWASLREPEVDKWGEPLLKQRSVEKLIRDLKNNYPDSFKKPTQKPERA